MDSLLAYKNLIQIHSGDNSKVYQARRSLNQNQSQDQSQDRWQSESVILKILNTDYPSPDQIRRYKQEYYLTSQIKLPSLVNAYGLEEWQRTLVMVLEDFGGTSLQRKLEELARQNLTREKLPRLELTEFLPISIKIADSLGQLHSQNIIHKDINPSNIVLNSTTGVLKLIDLGISTQICRENPVFKTPNALEGTLPFTRTNGTHESGFGLSHRFIFFRCYLLRTTNGKFALQQSRSDGASPLPHCQATDSSYGCAFRYSEDSIGSSYEVDG